MKFFRFEVGKTYIERLPTSVRYTVLKRTECFVTMRLWTRFGDICPPKRYKVYVESAFKSRTGGIEGWYAIEAITVDKTSFVWAHSLEWYETRGYGEDLPK